MAEFILFDRTMRYPGEPDWSRNFDSGTGLLLLAYLREAGALSIVDGRLALALDGVDDAAERFIAEVETLEALSDDAYLAGAEAMVRRFLPPPKDGEIRFGTPRFLHDSAFGARIGAAPTIPFRFDETALAHPLRDVARSWRGHADA